MANEIRLRDSLLINPNKVSTDEEIDKSTAKKISEKLCLLREEEGIPVRYFITGKITSAENFNLLLLRTESNTCRYVYIISFQKDGTFIEFAEVASSAESRHFSREINATLYPDLTLLENYNITTNLHQFRGTIEQKITPEGKFVTQQSYSAIPRE
jgi:hypothetical protein